jgi:hypothetical protein
MFVREVTFSIGNTMPLEPISHDQDDRYANVKPETTVTVAFGPKECNPETEAGKALLQKGFEVAQEASFQAMLEFRQAFKKLYE